MAAAGLGRLTDSRRASTVAIELSSELLELERAAWSEIRAGVLSVKSANTVLSAVSAHAEATGQDRLAVEMELKRRVRHPADD